MSYIEDVPATRVVPAEFDGTHQTFDVTIAPMYLIESEALILADALDEIGYHEHAEELREGVAT